MLRFETGIESRIGDQIGAVVKPEMKSRIGVRNFSYLDGKV